MFSALYHPGGALGPCRWGALTGRGGNYCVSDSLQIAHNLGPPDGTVEGRAGARRCSLVARDAGLQTLSLLAASIHASVALPQIKAEVRYAKEPK
jgi:hypothetical protein